MIILRVAQALCPNRRLSGIVAPGLDCCPHFGLLSGPGLLEGLMKEEPREVRPEDADYLFWREQHPCLECNGTGIYEEDGTERPCSYCDGCGIDPEADFEG